MRSKKKVKEIKTRKVENNVKTTKKSNKCIIYIYSQILKLIKFASQ